MLANCCTTLSLVASDAAWLAAEDDCWVAALVEPDCLFVCLLLLVDDEVWELVEPCAELTLLCKSAYALRIAGLVDCCDFNLFIAPS